MFMIIGAIIVVVAWIVFFANDNKRREKILDWSIPIAVKIAQNQGWVSSHRLKSQLDLTQSDAQMILRSAAEKGFLVQAVNGRYYANPDGQYITISPEKEIEVELLPKKHSGYVGGVIKVALWSIVIIVGLIFLISLIPDKITTAEDAAPAAAPPQPTAEPTPKQKSHNHSWHK